MLRPRSLILICFLSHHALWFLPAAFSEVLSSAVHEPFNPHFLVGNYPSSTNPYPIIPNFYSYPFPIYGTALGLTSLWYSFSPCIACLLLPHWWFFFLSKILFWLRPQLPGSDLFSSAVPWFSKATGCSPSFSAFLPSFCHSGKQSDRHGFFATTN